MTIRKALREPLMVPVNLGRRRVPVNRNVCYESTYLPQDHPYQTPSIYPKKVGKIYWKS